MKISKRRYTQLIAAVLYNCNIKGFMSGGIYQGAAKGVCVPGLNCYSCPGAVASCPLGSLQSGLLSPKYKFPYYILGTLILFGLLLGRFICGFLCPFGLLQELFYKLPLPKIRKCRFTRILSYLKYVILAIFVILIPLVKLAPGFCKYICPAGTIEAGIPLVSSNPQLQSLIGFLFSWKIFVLALVGVKVDTEKCINCNKCVDNCLMDVHKVGDRECIHCGTCVGHCPVDAIRFGIKNTDTKKQVINK